MWYNPPLHYYLYLFIIWRFLEEDGITSQMECYFSILLVSILLSHIGLLCLFACLYFLFIIIFVTEVFERPSGGDSP